jgi:hypothetical protein
MRLRNTARVHGSGEKQKAAERLLVDLRAYRRGELVYASANFGAIPPGGTLVVREQDLALPAAGDVKAEDEFLVVARVRAEGSESFASQEHHLVYTHAASKTQAHLLYDQQPARAPDAARAPVVFLMPKIWIGDDISTYVLVCNTWDVAEAQPQAQPVRFSLLDERGLEVSSWEHTFFYNEAKAFDLRARVGRRAGAKPRFFNLVGRGGASSFVLFAVVRNLKSNHFAVEHSLPPLYYMDGPMAAVRSQGCDVRLFEPRAGS